MHVCLCPALPSPLLPSSRRMEADGRASLFLYTGYSFMASCIFFLMTGTLGFLGCYAFVRRIYSVIKVD